MGRILIIKGADFSRNAISNVVLPETPETPETKTIGPSLDVQGTDFENGVGSFIGPLETWSEDAIIKTILSSTNKTDITVSVIVINPITTEVVSCHRDIPMTGYETDVESLGIVVPSGCYVGYGNKLGGMTVQGSFSFVKEGNIPHFEASYPYDNESFELKPTAFAGLKITIGCVLKKNV